MKLPSEEEIARAKAEAAKRGARAVLVTYDDPDVDAAVIVATMTAAQFATFLDTSARSPSDAHAAALVDHGLWPSPDEIDAIRRTIPAFPGLVAKDLAELAGNFAGDPELTKLSASTPQAKLDRGRLPKEALAQLLAKYPEPGALTLAFFPPLDVLTPGSGFSCVLKRPSPAVYEANIRSHARAKGEASGIWQVCATMARDVIAWTSETGFEPPDLIFERWPYVVSEDLANLFAKVGGAGAKGKRREL